MRSFYFYIGRLQPILQKRLAVRRTVQRKRCFDTSNIPEIPLSSNMFKPSLGFLANSQLAKHTWIGLRTLIETVATAMTYHPLSTTFALHQPRRRTHDLQILQWWHLWQGTGNKKNRGNQDNRSLKSIRKQLQREPKRLAIMPHHWFISNKDHWNHQRWNSIRARPIRFVDEAMLATPSFTGELHLAKHVEATSWHKCDWNKLQIMGENIPK